MMGDPELQAVSTLVFPIPVALQQFVIEQVAGALVQIHGCVLVLEFFKFN
jgi:hypothetical protein